MSDRYDTTNSSESETEMSEEISESEPVMSEESSKEEEDENDDDIPRQLSLNSSSPSEEIFLFDTRGRTRIAKKKPRLDMSKTKRSCATKFSDVATKTKSVSRGGKSSMPPKKSFPGLRSHWPRSRSLASGTQSTPSPRFNSNVRSTVPRTEPSKRMLPGHTPTTRHGGQSSSSSSSQDKPETYPERSDSEYDPTDHERPIKSVLGEISNMLGTVIKRLEKTESKLESMERRLEKSSSSSGSSSEAISKKKVPQVVRVSQAIIIRPPPTPPPPQINFQNIHCMLANH